jgi:hypothetical protein
MEPALLPGEVVRASEEGLCVTLLNGPLVTLPNPYAVCQYVLTNARIIFRPLVNADGKVPFRGPIVLPLAALDTVTMEAQTGRSKETILCLELQCRDCQVVSILFSGSLLALGKRMFGQLKDRAFTAQFPFDHYAATMDLSGALTAGTPRAPRFGCYSARRDFERMGIPDSRLALNVTVNANFQLVPSYPAALCVPADISDALLIKSAAFRSKRRFPVVIWKGSKTGLLLRSSQPQVGVGMSRSEDDEALLGCVAGMGVTSRILMIFDVRPRINAYANHATASGGCEVTVWSSSSSSFFLPPPFFPSFRFCCGRICPFPSASSSSFSQTAIICIMFSDRSAQNTMFYPFAVLQFGNVENIHAVRASYEKLVTLLAASRQSLNDDCDEWDKKLLATGWQKHIYSILCCARTIADWLLDGKNILIHCSDGWDRTPQCTSLVQLMLDPVYRSCEGFAVLVEKDWVAYGHNFNSRHGGDQQNLKERSPVFLQFLSCVMQLVWQFPTAFEFTSAFLVALHRESVSGYCGTFAADTPLKRWLDRVDDTTHR